MMLNFSSRLSFLALSLGCVLLSNGGCANRGMTAPSEPIVCGITRDECVAESLDESGIVCTAFQTVSFTRFSLRQRIGIARSTFSA